MSNFFKFHLSYVKMDNETFWKLKLGIISLSSINANFLFGDKFGSCSQNFDKNSDFLVFRLPNLKV